MTQIQPNAIGIEKAIGLAVDVESSEIRCTIQSNVSQYVTNAGFLIPMGTFANGTGPTLDITVPQTTFPRPFEQGYLTPLRLIVVVDRQPTGPATSAPTIDQVLDFSWTSGGSMLTSPHRQSMRRRFVVVHDEVIHPGSQSIYSVARTVNWVKLLGAPLRIQFNRSGSSAYEGIAANAPICYIGTGFHNGLNQFPVAPEYSITTYYDDM